MHLDKLAPHESTALGSGTAPRSHQHLLSELASWGVLYDYSHRVEGSVRHEDFLGVFTNSAAKGIVLAPPWAQLGEFRGIMRFRGCAVGRGPGQTIRLQAEEREIV